MNKVIIALSMLLMCCQQNVDSNLKVYEIEDFFNNVSISGGYFSTDGEKIIYSSNQSGIFNIYEANIQTGKTNPFMWLLFIIFYFRYDSICLIFMVCSFILTFPKLCF